MNINGNEGKLASSHYQNGGLPDLQATFHEPSWSHVIDPLSGATGDHAFDMPQNGSRMFDPHTSLPTPLMTMQQQMSYQDMQRRPITAAHNFPTQNIRSGNGVPSMSANGRWNSQPSSIGPPPHLQQQSQSPTWNASSAQHGFPSLPYARAHALSAAHPSLAVFQITSSVAQLEYSNIASEKRTEQLLSISSIVGDCSRPKSADPTDTRDGQFPRCEQQRTDALAHEQRRHGTQLRTDERKSHRRPLTQA